MADKMQRIVLARRPKGEPVPDDFRLEEDAVPACPDGGILVRVLWQSLDPYMRGRMDESKSYAQAVPVGGTMEAGCVGEVIESHSDRFRPGDIVEGRFGWCTHAASAVEGVRKVDPSLAPIQTALGVLGMPGLTAYVGLLDHGRPREGETLVVGAATGAVGSVVGQLGKIRGLRVVGVAGGPEKCAFAVDELGFDACVDHRAAADADALGRELAAACPDGVDVYFENVGGKTLDAVIPLMNVFGRIPVCGMISQYNLGGLGMAGGGGPDRLPRLWRTILVQRLSVRGFIIFDHYDRAREFQGEVAGYLRDGRIKYREWVTEGLENAPAAFLQLLKGGNFGKALVKVAEPST
jgi:NADPH-dependent curcumin reductase CurA